MPNIEWRVCPFDIRSSMFVVRSFLRTGEDQRFVDLEDENEDDLMPRRKVYQVPRGTVGQSVIYRRSFLHQSNRE